MVIVGPAAVGAAVDVAAGSAAVLPAVVVVVPGEQAVRPSSAAATGTSRGARSRFIPATR